MISKMLTTADGKIPFLQIIIGVIVGAIGMFLYAKFCKPPWLFTPAPSASAALQDVKDAANKVIKNDQPVTQQQEPQVLPRTRVEPQTVGPSFIDLRAMAIPMPKLPTVYENDEYSNEPSEAEEDDEDDDDDLPHQPRK